jgi:hypothetical protein
MIHIETRKKNIFQSFDKFVLKVCGRKKLATSMRLRFILGAGAFILRSLILATRALKCSVKASDKLNIINPKKTHISVRAHVCVTSLSL